MSDEDVPRKRFKADVEDEALENAVNSILTKDIQGDSSSNDENQDQESNEEQSEEGDKRDERAPTPEKPTKETDPSSVMPTAPSHCDIIAEHYNTLEEKGWKARGSSRIFYMRNFNNWIKSCLIRSFLMRLVPDDGGEDRKTYVLDMGCGKGGDLFKWKDGRVSHVIFADLAETSVQQCKNRFMDLETRLERQHGKQAKLFTAEFISADCTRARLRDFYKDPSIKLDFVSCQFAFHYCWESLPQAECMLKNASECLRIGGFFVGTCPNSNTIMSRLRKAGGKHFGNSVYSVTFDHEYPEGSTPELFGTKYHFHLEGVVDCPEFLVHFPTLRKLAEKWGFQLCIKQPFSSFYRSNTTKGDLAKLLQIMNALEPYPPRRDSKLVAAEEEYDHAREVFESLRERDPRNVTCVGTLSKSEWEAVTLYLVFAFKKIRDPNPDL